MEAQLCGCPVVAFDVGGLPEIVHHQETGVLVMSCDQDGMKAAINGLLADPSRSAAMGVQARQKAAARFSLAAHSERWNRWTSTPLNRDTAG
jgi:glycosyltransferase involved in cell wall biosynthesis